MIEYAFPTRERAERWCTEQKEKGRFYTVVATDTAFGVVWDDNAAACWHEKWLKENTPTVPLFLIAAALVGWIAVIIWACLQ